MISKAAVLAKQLDDMRFSSNKARNLEAAIFQYGLSLRNKTTATSRRKISPKEPVSEKGWKSLIPAKFDSKSKYLQHLLQTSSRANVSRKIRQMGIPLRYSELISAEKQIQS